MRWILEFGEHQCFWLAAGGQRGQGPKLNVDYIGVCMLSGYSWKTFDELILSILTLLKPSYILDIGAGEGEFGRIIRESGLSDVVITGLEYEELRRDELLAIGYNQVRTMSALDLMNEPAQTYEVILLGDVIEHFRKSEGQDLLEFLNYRSSYIFIVTPEAMPMSCRDFYEGHNSLWRPHCMRWHDFFLHQRVGVMHFYLLRGYLKGCGVSFQQIQKHIEQKQLLLRLGDTRESGEKVLYHQANLALHNSQPFDPIPGSTEIVSIYRPN